MSTVIYHNHHIIPKHAGGTDAPENIVRLTPEEHSKAHRLLYEKYGRWQDKIAYRALAGHIGKEEIIKEKLHHAGKMTKDRKATLETRKKISEGLKGKKRKPFTEEAKRNMSIARKTRKNTTPAKGMKHTPEFKEAQSKRMKGNKISNQTEKKIGMAHKVMSTNTYTSTIEQGI
jgi:hypothetical protein